MTQAISCYWQSRRNRDSISFDEWIDLDLWIDVFPIDGLPDSIAESEEVFKKCKKYRKRALRLYESIYLDCNWPLKLARTLYVTAVKAITTPRQEMQKIERLSRRIAYEDANYVGQITWAVYGIKERIPKSAFVDTELVQFEGKSFFIMKGYKEYLHSLYGDYMVLPPVNQRNGHGYTAWKSNKEI